LNSNTTDRKQRRGGRRNGRRSSFARSHGERRTSERRPTGHPPALTPIECDATPVAFTSLAVDARLLEGVRDLGFVETRPVQSAVIPLALGGADLIACAETGTGKTCAFVLPTLQRLLTADLKVGTTTAVGTTTEVVQAFRPAHAPRVQPPAPSRSRVLILAPTRELAVQIEDEIHGLAYHTSITSAAVYGGVEMGGQERALRAGVDIIVATPGRLMDHMRQQNADLGAIELLVLDEADRMMDMGFWPDVKRIIAVLPSARQTLLFSATMPDEVVRLALEIMREPRFIQVGQRSKPATSISHQAVIVPSSRKLEWLIDHLRRPAGPVLVFTRTKIGADRLSRQLAAAGIRCTALHADRSQDQRRAAVEGFRGGRYLVLVATDIAARGLDIDGIHTVINYELPDSPDAYVHRVGRTGRADEVGHAITLVLPDERADLAVLEKSVGVRLECKQDV
jgi:ATP-dependent RNA helicase RhlE